MKIISWNVNGIRAIRTKGFIEWVKKESPDILCVQETKAYPEQLDPDLRDLEGYNSYWNNPSRKGYAGVSIYTKTEPDDISFDFTGDDFDSEGRMLCLRFSDFALFNVYFPNGRRDRGRLDYKLEFYERFLLFIDGMKNTDIVVCGDVNTAHKEIDLARPKQNEIYSGFLPVERKWMDKLVSHGYVDTFRRFNPGGGHYTWWDYKSRARERNVGWRIDYFFVGEKTMPRVRDSYILKDVPGSDHCPVGIEFV